ncbi:Uncharacterized protein FKW44_001872 [Caligus rogercresseyi]|uniref:Uncharacterized protein n=1 Tax=Caligus rogercresseyi TaxID=217165 RepID=A0A7T8QVX0_CALRO|nr:Uncharacterized protein FKW44_001872 [Caligus rogercresseyi]
MSTLPTLKLSLINLSNSPPSRLPHFQPPAPKAGRGVHDYRYEEFRSRSKLIKSAANTGLESGRIQVVRSNSLINAFRLMINELRGPQCVVSPMNTESLRSHLRIIVDGGSRGAVLCSSGNEEFIQPILECSLEVILGLFPVPNPPEIDPGLVNRILSDMFMSGFLNYNDRQNSLIRELVEEGDATRYSGACIIYVEKSTTWTVSTCGRFYEGVLGEFTESVLRESRRVIVYID